MKKMSKGMLMTALICGSVYLGGSTPVYANELQEFALDEYVVTAARTETKLVDTPANISVVDAQTIEERHYQDVSEVLKDVPGANVLDNGNGINEKKIVLNGDERVLILVDGRRVNNDMGTMTRSSYDMNMLPDVELIDRIEVLKGAGGALYGSDAVGGVVNIITKKSDISNGKISVGFGSQDTRDMSAMYSFRKDDTGVTISASKNKQGYFKYKDVKSDTTKKWLGSEYDNEKMSININHKLSNVSELTVGYDYSKVDGMSNWRVDATAATPYEKETSNFYTKLGWNNNKNNSGYVQFYHNELEYSNAGILEEETNGLDLQQEMSISENNKLVIGGSWRKSDVNSTYDRYQYGPAPDYDFIGVIPAYKNYDESIDNIAFFVNDTWEFMPSWILNTGIRYDNHSEAGSETTISAGLNKKFDDNSHAYLNWGQVFKAPTVDDLYYNNTADYMFGNPNLNPETGEVWTIGYNATLNDKTNVGISYFKSDIDDAISWLYNPDTYGYYATNVANQEKKGMEFNIAHQLNDNIEVIASYTYINVKNDYNDGGFLRDYHYIPNTYRLGLNYHDGKWDTNIWLRYASGGSTSFNDRYNYYETSGDKTKPTKSYVESNYVTLDLAITYKATKDLNFYVKGYNLFNEAYAEQAGVLSNGSYEYPAQSRRFIVGAEYKF